MAGGREPDDTGKMTAPSTLDLLVLTFNCAAKLINVPIFAGHLQSALGRDAAELPEVVVLSLQEVAPLSYAFIGDYFLRPYVDRFDEALNLAASLQSQSREEDDVSASSSSSASHSIHARKPYSLIRTLNVGYTAIMMFARDPARLKDIQEAEVGFGAAEMGNKGAVGLRALYEVGGESTELTFVATHLAAMEWNLPRRNANWGTIMRGLTFENPEEVLSQMRRDAESRSESISSEEGDASEQARLLRDEHHQQDLRLQQQFHNLSVFKPSSHLFVAGDLNYRISTTSPTPYSAFPNMDPGSENYYTNFFHLDQLTRERLAGRTLHGLSEHPVTFPPTYKYVVDSKTPPPESAGSSVDEVKWNFAPHRYPGWTDRILFLELPSWVGAGSKIDVRSYDALPVIRTSDHRPVFLRARVPLVAPADLAPPAAVLESAAAGSASPGGSGIDPRVRLPVEIDPEAWDRRVAARRREIAAGWTMFLWSTRQGAYILASVLAASAGGYWLYRSA
ncbi:phosphatidylinositol polyphosphate phosphatase [Trichoderma arundinaceum]|uniref:Phosphatidylinositol polyphosphate phosphatase n=1 Tax=Trichoderma arundinaceum TaxID=490622 RepID=A0A395N9Q6_TRIAR|nr:phosphatidylinositol polyphosphate phosphatase [Trichoderma arundinaceum]